MNILFILRHAGFVRNFEPALRILCERGHRVHVGFVITKERHWMADSINLAGQLSSEYPNFSTGMVPAREDAWGLIGSSLRASIDYLRYLTPYYRDAPKLRERAAEFALESVGSLTRSGPLANRPGRALVSAACRLAERSIPLGEEVTQVLEEQRPDVLLCSPLVEPGTPQMEYVRAARSLGIPVVLCVGSWDNLTNKGLIHGPMDLVTVWNDAMKREAVELHGVPSERVVITGAQIFDHWFAWKPSTSREEFCARVGLQPAEPYVLYVCSSRFIASDEVSFVRRWIQELRGAASRRLRSAGVLIRPHPQNEEQWRDFDATEYANVAVYPRAGAIPVDDTSKADYFDSMYHGAAVVGINTTAEIESAIVGRPVYTVLAPEFRDTQEGTIHFHYLRHEGGGIVQAASSFAEHLAALDMALAQGGDEERCRRFVEAFVRPYGVDVPAAPKLVEAIEAVTTRAPVRAKGTPIIAALLRPLLKRRGEQLRHEADQLEQVRAAQVAQRRQEAKDRKKRLMKERARQARLAANGALNEPPPNAER
jgi:hypothetical protein